MNPRQARSLLSLYAVDVFLDTNADRLPATYGAEMRIRFKRALAELELHVQIQSAAPLMAMGLTRARDAKREALLRDHLAPIARIAKLECASHPELQALKMPRGEPATQKLLAHAAGMATIAERYHDVFVRAGRPSSFIDDLNDAIEDIFATLTSRSERRGARSGATRGIVESIKRCKTYKAVIASFIESEARNDRPLLSNWRSIQRVGKSSRRRRLAPAVSPAHPHSLPAPALPIQNPARLLASPPISLAASRPDQVASPDVVRA